MKGTDVIYRHVKFSSFVELSKIHKDEDKYKAPITLRYDGTDTAGDVEICVSAGHSELRADFLKKAAEILQIL